MSTLPARRGQGGHFLPGVSGNPGGRTSALAEVRALLKPNVGLYVERLNELVRHPDPTVALPALREALDRLLGKPVQSVEQDVRTLDVGAAIRDLWLQTVQQPPVPMTTIEGEASHTTTTDTTDVVAVTATIATSSHDGADATAAKEPW
jgi:hypothetical protein